MQIRLLKTATGYLAPATGEDADLLTRIKVGKVVRVEMAEMRNGPFFRKWWALVDYAYGLWEETHEPTEYKGEECAPSFDRFRKDLTILAGFYTATYNIRGEVRLEAKSISWAQMKEPEFEKLYSKTIDVILRKVLHGRGLTEEQLREHAERVLEFA